MERNELILFVLWDDERGRFWASVQSAACSPLPDGAVPLCRIDYEDRGEMLRWVIGKLRKRWPLAKIKRHLQ